MKYRWEYLALSIAFVVIAAFGFWMFIPAGSVLGIISASVNLGIAVIWAIIFFDSKRW